MSKPKCLGVIIADADEKFLQHPMVKIDEEKHLTKLLSKKYINQQWINPLHRDFSPLFNEVELKIIGLILEEKTTKQIAEILFLSPRTVDDKRKQINEKLGVKTPIGLVIKTIQLGIFKICLKCICLLAFTFPDLFCLEMLNDPSFF